MDGQLTIRTLRPDEVQKWLDFMCRDIFPDDPREAVESMCHDDPCKDVSGIFIAADANGDIVGSVKAACRGLSVCGSSVRAGILSGVGVRRDLRGQGLSKRLFAACDEYLLGRNAHIIHLYSDPDTLRFYVHNGYSYLPQRPGEDFFRMYRVLKPFALRNIIVPDTNYLVALLTTYPAD